MKRFRNLLNDSMMVYYVFFVCLMVLFCIILATKPSTDYVVFNHNNEILGLDMLDHEGTFDYEYEPTM